MCVIGVCEGRSAAPRSRSQYPGCLNSIVGLLEIGIRKFPPSLGTKNLRIVEL